MPGLQSSVPVTYTLMEEKEPLPRNPLIRIQMQWLPVTRELTSEAVSELLWIHTGLSFALTGGQYLNWGKFHCFKLEKQNICGAGM